MASNKSTPSCLLSKLLRDEKESSRQLVTFLLRRDTRESKGTRQARVSEAKSFLWKHYGSISLERCCQTFRIYSPQMKCQNKRLRSSRCINVSLKLVKYCRPEMCRLNFNRKTANFSQDRWQCFVAQSWAINCTTRKDYKVGKHDTLRQFNQSAG